MNALFRNPLTTLATVIAVGLGAMTMTARPAAALSDRDAVGLALGLGAAAIVLHQVDKNTGKSRKHHYAPPPPPRYSQNRGHDRWDRGYDRREYRGRGPDRRDDFRHDFRGGPNRNWR
ncbi:MAG TPA: hypothetical protein VGC40_01600 [Paenirhodobacter sp.]